MSLTPVTFTSSALDEIKKLKTISSSEQKPYLRIGVKQGGCAGYEYIFDFDEKHDTDFLYPIDKDLEIIIDKDQSLLIPKLVVDFENGLNNRGFIFKNPNATTTCGCGQSFS